MSLPVQNLSINYSNRLEKKYITFWKHLFAGSISGAVSRTIVAPLERVKLIL